MGVSDRFIRGDFHAFLPLFWLFARIGFDTEVDHGLTIGLRGVDGTSVMRAEAGRQAAGKNSVTGLCHSNIKLRIGHLSV